MSLRNLVRRLYGRPALAETGEENAARFVRVVTSLAKEGRVLHLSSSPHRRGELGDWVWMNNPLWRARVLELLKDAPIKSPTFLPPDNFDLWSFLAISTVSEPRIAKLSLSERY